MMQLCTENTTLSKFTIKITKVQGDQYSEALKHSELTLVVDITIGSFYFNFFIHTSAIDMLVMFIVIVMLLTVAYGIILAVQVLTMFRYRLPKMFQITSLAHSLTRSRKRG